MCVANNPSNKSINFVKLRKVLFRLNNFPKISLLSENYLIYSRWILPHFVCQNDRINIVMFFKILLKYQHKRFCLVQVIPVGKAYIHQRRCSNVGIFQYVCPEY